MKNTGRILCTDNAEKRAKRLAGNLRRLGLKGSEVCLHDWLAGPLPPEIFARYRPGFDAVLIDAPCSNTGVLRRRVDVRWRLAAGSFLEMQAQQLALLEAIAPLTKPGGRLVYSTCSIEPEENEGVAQRFASLHPQFHLAEMSRTLPHRDGVDGGFAALFTRRH
jgi:16S rRNA (cytosine967-C5)-methyltransferase